MVGQNPTAVSQVLVPYLHCVPGPAEERGLGGEESDVFTLIVQAAVPTTHAVTAGHGGGHHRTDGHGSVQRWPPAPGEQPRGRVTASGSVGLLQRAKVTLMLSRRSEFNSFSLISTHPDKVSARLPLHPRS